MSAATKKTSAATAATAKTEEVAYLGPDIKRVAINGTVYTAGLPKSLEEKIAQVPALKGLVVPISKLAEAGVAIATKGTALNNLYNVVQSKLKELEEIED